MAPQELHLLGGSVVEQCLHYHHARHVSLFVGGKEFAGYDIDRLTQHIWSFSVAALHRLYPATQEDRP